MGIRRDVMRFRRFRDNESGLNFGTKVGLIQGHYYSRPCKCNSEVTQRGKQHAVREKRRRRAQLDSLVACWTAQSMASALLLLVALGSSVLAQERTMDVQPAVSKRLPRHVLVFRQVEAGVCPSPSPCWQQSGLFADPSDCCGFFNCAYCRAYRQRCALGTVFDRRLGLCNYPYAAPPCLAPNPGCYLHY
ncbi:uncharacterized protein LOC135398029 [Ornithodoros turicata]|uniref:uncharacterized protein LOC135398029 n=1 Tax=Ornithodoros turicata TaxID=34597 RepID=UPI003138A23D